MLRSLLPALLAAALLPGATGAMAAPDGQPKGRITGVGGVFVTSRDPKALAAWYRDVLGMPLQAWGGATFPGAAPGAPKVVTWNAFSQTSGYLAPSPRPFMINFVVDDLDAMIARLTARGVPILKRDDGAPYGRFAWILDPDGTKIELWEPKS